jgi:hypothetical protein
MAEQQQLEDYRATLATLVKQYARARPAPPKPLTIPTIFGRKYSEDFISDYLAYALDPSQNGIGEAPLAQLLRLCGVDLLDVPLAKVTVHREYSLETGRIDLVLEWQDTLVMGIENKILSAEGKEQTVRYARAFRKQFKDTPYHLVYLTPGGKRAGSRAFQSVSYAQLLEALRGVRLSPDFSARRRILWEDFLEHLEVYIVMSDPEHFEFSEKAQLYLEHLEMILDLQEALQRDWDDAISYIGGQVSAHLEGGLWTINFGGKSRHQQIYKPSWKLPEVWVHFEYYFSVDDLRQKRFSLMVDVEGKEGDGIRSLFDQRYATLEAQYQNSGIEHHPSRRVSIAWKEYTIARDVDQIAQAFIDALDEFRFLEPEIDEVLAEWSQSREART